MKKLVLLFVLTLGCFFGFSQDKLIPGTHYFEGQLIVKIKAQFGDKCAKTSISIPSINKLVQEQEISTIHKLFPKHKSPKNKKLRPELVDLSTIYRFEFDKNLNEEKLLNQIRKDKSVAYAELNYINYLTYTPTDSINNEQWYLDAIKAYDAWDIQKGDTNVVIAITDTGSDMDHEDLVDDYAYNYADPINGIDDDNDGYIDNFNGWDVANNDNDPGYTNSGHGTNVIGIASASTDNTKGISGCGFNTRILTIKIDDAGTGQLTGAYQGIVYAADYGAFIISNSWGSYSYSQFNQDVINYAALNKGALVICATGNGPFSGPNAGIGDEIRFYPAAYENVLSVGATYEQDTVKLASNYGYWSNIFAPGERMTTTNNIGSYSRNGGTSMAAPVVAGVAALVKSQFPSYSANQVREQILNTGDDIYAINDSKYLGKLGGGRINAFKAVSDSSAPGISLINRIMGDNNDGLFTLGDTVRISGDFKNFLQNASNVSVSIKSIGDKLQVLDGTRTLGNIDKLDSVSINNNPFLLKVIPGLEFNETIDIEVSINADNYSKKEYFTILANVDYITITENNLTVTLTSDAGLGFGGATGDLGEGIKYLGGTSLLFNGSFIIGNSSNYIPNKFRTSTGLPDHFDVLSTVRPTTPKIADYEARTIYNDGKLSPVPKIEITQKTYVFKHGDADNSIIYQYGVKNVSGAKLSNFYAGLMLDWDIERFSTNKIIYDSLRSMGISFSTDTNLYCGVKVLNDSIGKYHYGIDNVTGGNGGVNLANGFSDSEKLLVLSSNRHHAGNVNMNGNDIVDVNSVGPFDVENGDTKYISFAITISDSLNTLNIEADSIQNLFNRLILGTQENTLDLSINSLKVFPNPSSNKLSIELKVSNTATLDLKIVDIQGKLIQSESNKVFNRGLHQIDLDISDWKTGIYLLEISGDKLLFQNKFVVAK